MRDIRGLREVEELIRANSEMRSGVYNPASLSAYSLAQNNPTTFTDPDGNTPAMACTLVWVPGVGQAACLGGLIATGLLAVGLVATLATPGDSVVKAENTEEKAEPDAKPAPEAVDSPDGRNPAQDKPLTKGEIERLKDAGIDIHDLKGDKNASKRDLYKTPKGDILVKPKGGAGEGEPTGLNIKDF
jgi:hypothetical protein